MQLTKYKYILWDIDDTLLNFKKSERAALQQCFDPYNIQLSDEDITIYSEINHNYWKQLEEGTIEKNVLLVQRFRDFGEFLNKDLDAVAINSSYQLALGDHVIFHEGAQALCNELNGQVKQYAITNGTAIAQDKKLKNSGLIHIFDDVFISDKIGYEKPDIRFFEYAFSKIPDFKKEEALLIGDSLTSDMKGANNAGITCCWYNFKGLEAPTSLRIDYNIQHLNELRNILAN